MSFGSYLREQKREALAKEKEQTLHEEMQEVMPPGHTMWHVPHQLLCRAPESRRGTLAFLLHHMVMVQVAKYASLVAGLGIALLASLFLCMCAEVSMGVVQLTVPWLGSILCWFVVSHCYSYPAYDVMCKAIRADTSLLHTLRRAGEADPVLQISLRVIERRLSRAA